MSDQAAQLQRAMGFFTVADDEHHGAPRERRPGAARRSVTQHARQAQAAHEETDSGMFVRF